MVELACCCSLAHHQLRCCVLRLQESCTCGLACACMLQPQLLLVRVDCASVGHLIKDARRQASCGACCAAVHHVRVMCGMCIMYVSCVACAQPAPAPLAGCVA